MIVLIVLWLVMAPAALLVIAPLELDAAGGDHAAGRQPRRPSQRAPPLGVASSSAGADPSRIPSDDQRSPTATLGVLGTMRDDRRAG